MLIISEDDVMFYDTPEIREHNNLRRRLEIFYEQCKRLNQESQTIRRYQD